MYLIQIDPKTGMISEEVSNSGWMAIKEFRTLYEKHGISAMTVVALAKDYLSIISYFNNKERPIRAMEEVYGSRDKFDINSEIFQYAMNKYDELQFNSELEQERLNNEISQRLLEQMRKANKEEDDKQINVIRRSMQDHQKYIDSFKSSFSKEEAVKKAVTSNGYELSRIENDIRSRKNSKFKNQGEDLKNPNKLGLT